jgi:plastocyanin
MSVRVAFIIASLVFISACASSSSPTTPSSSPSPTGNAVSIVQGAAGLTTTAFNPNPLTISKGTTVTWMNNDSTTHTSTSNNSGPWSSGSIDPGGTFSFTFQSSGSFAYHCAIHPGMVGTITVQ